MEIKDVLKEFVSEDLIKKTVRETVKKAVEEKFTYILDKEIEMKMREVIDGKADDYIIEEVNKVMNGKVRKDDGWGKVETYESFDDFVRNQILHRLRMDWNVEKKIRDALDEKIKKYADESVKKFKEEDVNAVLQAMAKDILKSEEKNNGR